MFSTIYNLIRGIFTQHHCQNTIDTGLGTPCVSCREEYLEQRTKREHQYFLDAKEKTTTLDKLDPEYVKIRDAFEQNCNNSYIVHRIDKNNNFVLISRYENAKKNNRIMSQEKLLYHGAKQARNHKSIFENGFLLSCSLHGSLGKGIYFADDISYSDSGYVFSTTIGEHHIRTILLCKVLFVPGSYQKSGNIQAIYDESLCYPQYLIYYKPNQSEAA